MIFAAGSDLWFTLTPGIYNKQAKKNIPAVAESWTFDLLSMGKSL